MQSRKYSQGAELTETGVNFRVWALGKQSVKLAILDEAGSVRRELAMAQEDEGYYEVTDPEATVGTLYKYRVDGNYFPDPSARFQPFGVHGPSQVVDGRSFEWETKDWHAPTIQQLIVYELHVGTFSPEGTYLAIRNYFEHLTSLGVNAIELMPVADFPGARNWGYDNTCLFAPSRAYGTPDDLRKLVDAAHAAKLAVVLDVVYNHLGPDGNYFGAYSEAYFNNQHHTPWGAAFNFDGQNSAPVRRFFLENPFYWMEEFHVDGFRLDATHAIPDDSPKHLIQEMAELVQARGGLIVCEDPRNERKIIEQRERGGYGCDAVWADDFHHVVRVQMTKENEGYLGYFKGTPAELEKTVRHGWLFSGQLQRDGILRGTEANDLGPEHFVICISNHDQVGNRAFGDRLHQLISPEGYRAASALLLLAPYTPMLFMGQEFSSSSIFCFFTDHEARLGKNVTEGRRREFSEFSAFRDPESRERIPDPQAESTFLDSKMSWGDLAKPNHLAVFKLYQDLIRLRQRRLSDRRRGTWQAGLVHPQTLAIRYSPPGHRAVLVLTQLVADRSIFEADHSLTGTTRGWEFAFSSNEAIYGGEHHGVYDRSKKLFSLNQPETIVFLEQGDL